MTYSRESWGEWKVQKWAATARAKSAVCVGFLPKTPSECRGGSKRPEKASSFSSLLLRLLFVVLALLGDRAQRDRDRDFAEDLRVRRQPACILLQRRPIERGLFVFELVDHGGRATTDAQTHNAEIAVTRTALPDAGAEAARLFACRDLQQGGHIRIVVVEEHPLGVVRAQHLLPHLFQQRLVGLFLLGGGLASRPAGRTRRRRRRLPWRGPWG